MKRIVTSLLSVLLLASCAKDEKAVNTTKQVVLNGSVKKFKDLKIFYTELKTGQPKEIKIGADSTFNDTITFKSNQAILLVGNSIQDSTLQSEFLFFENGKNLQIDLDGKSISYSGDLATENTDLLGLTKKERATLETASTIFELDDIEKFKIKIDSIKNILLSNADGFKSTNKKFIETYKKRNETSFNIAKFQYAQVYKQNTQKDVDDSFFSFADKIDISSNEDFENIPGYDNLIGQVLQNKAFSKANQDSLQASPVYGMKLFIDALDQTKVASNFSDGIYSQISQALASSGKDEDLLQSVISKIENDSVQAAVKTQVETSKKLKAQRDSAMAAQPKSIPAPVKEEAVQAEKK